MLSVCIPVYNYNISKLLTQLLEQAKKLDIPWEILLIDDCSESEIEGSNKKNLENLPVRYRTLEKNIGRAAIRNLLCREAKYENLLFLDNDSILVSEHFLSNYLKHLNQNRVTAGGRCYPKSIPGKSFHLHWYYGKNREEHDLSVRNSNPYLYFFSNNFLIPSKILRQFPFPEMIAEYGHEDTVFAWTLSQNEIPVFHIDNPVLHEGLDTAAAFMDKTEAAVRNLNLLNESDKFEILGNIKLYRVFRRIEGIRMIRIFSSFWKMSRKIQRWMIQHGVGLWMLDFYKLGYLCYLQKKSNG